MSAAVKDPEEYTHAVSEGPDAHRSGEHSIGLDAMIRRSFEVAFESDLQTTARISRFELEEVLSSPEVRPSSAPEVTLRTTVEAARTAMAAVGDVNGPASVPAIVPTPIVNVVADDYEAISVGSLPPPAVEVDRTKEEERDP